MKCLDNNSALLYSEILFHGLKRLHSAKTDKLAESFAKSEGIQESNSFNFAECWKNFKSFLLDHLEPNPNITSLILQGLELKCSEIITDLQPDDFKKFDKFLASIEDLCIPELLLKFERFKLSTMHFDHFSKDVNKDDVAEHYVTAMKVISYFCSFNEMRNHYLKAIISIKEDIDEGHKQKILSILQSNDNRYLRKNTSKCESNEKDAHRVLSMTQTLKQSLESPSHSGTKTSAPVTDNVGQSDISFRTTRRKRKNHEDLRTVKSKDVFKTSKRHNQNKCNPDGPAVQLSAISKPCHRQSHSVYINCLANSVNTGNNYSYELNTELLGPIKDSPDIKELNDTNTNSETKRPVYSCPICECSMNTNKKSHEKTNRPKCKLIIYQGDKKDITSRKYFGSNYKEKTMTTSSHDISGSESLLNGKLAPQILTKDKSSNRRKMFCCRMCSKSFLLHSKYSLHLKLHSKEKYLKCDACNVSCKGLAKLERHKLTHTGEKPYPCKSCGTSFADQSHLNVHQRVHSGEKPFKCDLCNASFAESTKLKNHMHVHTGEKPFICEMCGASFSVLSSLKSHMKIHSGCRPYECDLCDFSSVHSSNLKAHMLIHTGEKKHTCDICGASFTETAKLKRHMMVHTGERPYNCEVCGSRFADKSHLTVHLRIHSGERPFKCTFCSSAFVESSKLKNHIRTHTGEKPYICEVCGASFAVSYSLKSHMRRHTGEKPYKCEICSYATSQSSNLKTHMVVHNGNRPYVCEECGASFSEPSKLNRHKKIHLDVEDDSSNHICVSVNQDDQVTAGKHGPNEVPISALQLDQNSSFNHNKINDLPELDPICTMNSGQTICTLNTGQSSAQPLIFQSDYVPVSNDTHLGSHSCCSQSIGSHIAFPNSFHAHDDPLSQQDVHLYHTHQAGSTLGQQATSKWDFECN